MFGATDVKHMAIEANINPPKNAKGITSKKSGAEINPNAATTASTIVVLIVALVAP
jgi:high-affinity Fe2+/Pb2+ permease